MDGEALRGGRYVVTRSLGAGAQGSTFEAVDKKEGRLVAVKRFDVRDAKEWKDVELAEREARVLARLAHPKLPAYIEHFEEGGRLYLVMEKIEGESLAERLRRGGRLDEAGVLRLLRDASDALAYLHGRGVVHRDLKPGNVIRREDGSFAFVDFGAVRDRMRKEGGSTVVGTFGYMAPEQFQGRAEPASDVYAVGATAVSMLTGKQPEELPHRGLGIDVRAALRGIAGPALTRTLERMLEPDPEKRAGRIELSTVRREERDREQPAEQSIRKEARRARRAARRARREAARAMRHRGRGPRPTGFLPLFFVLIALSVARVALSVALSVVVPAVLVALSLVFGPALREAARAVTRGGRRAYDAIDAEARSLAERAASIDAPTDAPTDARRIRVDDGAPRARLGSEDREENEPEEDARPSKRGRNGGA
jgi:hypothetical protein